jgi:hypothetical protein
MPQATNEVTLRVGFHRLADSLRSLRYASTWPPAVCELGKAAMAEGGRRLIHCMSSEPRPDKRVKMLSDQ